MTLTQLLARWRKEIGDEALPYLWDDDDGITYLNDAINEACRRSRLLIDSTTTDICRISLVAGQSSYTLDPRIILVRKARLENKTLPLEVFSWRDMDAANPGWESHTGTPTARIQDVQSGVLRLYKTPDSDAVAAYPYAWLTVVRLPLSEMASSASVTFQDTGDTVTHAAHGRHGGDRVSFSVITSTTGIVTSTEYFLRDVTTDTYKLAATPYDTAIALTTNGTGTASYGTNTPEIHSRFHLNLLHWMKYRAYSEDDVDKNNDKMAEKHLALFEREFGPPASAFDEEWAQTHESYDVWDGGR